MFSFSIFALLVVVSRALSPIIIVPGILSSNLEFKLNNFQGPCFIKTSDWQEAFTLYEGLNVPCLLSLLKLESNGTCSNNQQGVEIRAKDFGGIGGIDYVTSDSGLTGLIKVPVFHSILTSLEGIGYVQGKDLKGFSYDWRLFGDSCADLSLSSAFLSIIKDTYTSNNNAKVTLLGHSMGGNVIIDYLNTYASTDFIDKYVERIMLMSPANGGAARAPIFLLAGPDYADGVFASLVKPLSNSWPSLLKLLPKQNTINKDASVWNDELPILSTPSRNYTSEDMDQYISDLASANIISSALSTSFLSEILMFQRNESPVQLPLTKVLFINDVDTIRSAHFNSGDFKDFSYTVTSNSKGDGSVNLESTQGFCEFLQNNNQNVICQPMSFGGNVQHYSMLSNEKIISEIISFLSETTPPSSPQSVYMDIQ